MFGPPALQPDILQDLVARYGGRRTAARLLGVAEAELTRWLQRGNAPPMALRLLWYAGPDGRAEALADIENELSAVAAARDAADAELQRRRNLVDERRAALAARIAALEHENAELRRLLDANALAGEIGAIASVADRLLRTLTGRERPHDIASDQAA